MDPIENDPSDENNQNNQNIQNNQNKSEELKTEDEINGTKVDDFDVANVPIRTIYITPADPPVSTQADGPKLRLSFDINLQCSPSSYAKSENILRNTVK